MYNPWADAGERHRDWIIERAPLRGLHEVMCVRNKVILLEQNRTKWERRCDLAHAIAHIDLGHTDRLDRKSEQAAVRYAAKKLIGLDELVGALGEARAGRITQDDADRLGVDLQTLRVRLQFLHPAEKSFLLRSLEHLQGEHAA